MHYFLVLMLFSLNLLAVDKPNVVIILTDDLGWGDVSYHGGYIPTPNIDQLAEDGMELNRFYSNPVCSPTRASLLTGLHIFNHGVVRPFMNPAAEQTGMPPELKIMPQYFNEAGYQTALSGKWHLGTAKEEFWPTNRGFETSYGHMTGGIGYFDHTAAGRLDWHRNESTLREEGYSTELIANEAINIIKNKEQNRPLFLYVAFNAPHTPIEAPLKSIEKFSYLEDEKDRVYAANVNALDTEIGKIIHTIEDQGILEETIIVFFSDNGPVFDINPIVAVLAPGLTHSRGSTAGLRGSKSSAHEGGIRVPASIMWKGVLDNSKSDQYIFVQDLLPTLLSAAEIEVSDQIAFDGTDKWQSLITGNLIAPNNDFVGAKIVFDERALFNDEWKLHFRKPVMLDVEGTYSLFNVNDDPFETKDLSEIEVEVFNSMKETMMDMKQREVIPIIDPAHFYNYGDTEGGPVIGSPWLEMDYDISEYPSPTKSFFIIAWVMILAFKYYLIGFILLLTAVIFTIRKFRASK